MLDRSALLLKKRSLVILFTDFMGLDNLNDLNNSIRHLKFNQHEVVVFHVQHDSFENQFDLKNRYYHVVDMETGEKLKLHPREIKEVYQSRRESQIKQLNDLLVQHQVDVIDVNIEDGFEDVLLQYLVKKRKNKLNFLVNCLYYFKKIKFVPLLGPVVQLVRIPACHAGGRGFESRPI